VLSVFTHKGNTLPEARGFEVALLIGVGLCVLTAVLSYVIPGRVSTGRALSAHETEEVDELMEENAELGGVMLGEEASRRRPRRAHGERTMTDPACNPGPTPPGPERGGQPTGTARRRQGLFSQKGFEATTVREIARPPASTPHDRRYFGRRPSCTSRQSPSRGRASARSATNGPPRSPR